MRGPSPYGDRNSNRPALFAVVDDGVGGRDRFASELRQRVGSLLDVYDEIVIAGRLDTCSQHWLCWVWDLATPPMMRPGLVRYPGKVLDARLRSDGGGGDPIAFLDVACASPPALVDNWRGWAPGVNCGAVAPPEHLPAALSSVALIAPLLGSASFGELVDIDDGAKLVEAGHRTVAELVRRVEAAFGSALRALPDP